MKSPLFKFLFSIPLFLLITGVGKLTAQDTTPQISYSKQCLQMLKLSSDKMIFTKDKTEKPVKAIFIINPQKRTLDFSISENGKSSAMRKTEITDMNCTINPDFTQGKIVYSIIESNNDGTYSANEVLLEATPTGLYFSNNIDSINNKVLFVLKKE
ncbi:hypothetical protein BAS06_13220 [Elizabethkingia miricola]|uniref:Uncharacterized protein n=1 Tax=Elizabethkingia miricola TaxID=172045 RepID=A0ABD5B531_ELIMR|nr:hypothetical protein [Elizabethkingia miricola]MDQ8748501.1 hypothetical protein [Elizabethkingia miricola]OPB88478.1 hypothetical protein BAS06_13220 [Elizabethkingia miricola]